jgi:lysozyme
MNPEDRARLRDSVAGHEGLRLSPYLDTVNKLTIGVGRCLESKPLTGEEMRKLYDAGDIKLSLTSRGALSLLDDDIADAATAAARLPCDFSALDGVRQSVLIEMVYQLGEGGVKSFAKMLDAVKRRSFTEAAADMRLSAWYRQTNSRAETLAIRMDHGVW